MEINKVSNITKYYLTVLHKFENQNSINTMPKLPLTLLFCYLFVSCHLLTRLTRFSLSRAFVFCLIWCQVFCLTAFGWCQFFFSLYWASCPTLQLIISRLAVTAFQHIFFFYFLPPFFSRPWCLDCIVDVKKNSLACANSCYTAVWLCSICETIVALQPQNIRSDVLCDEPSRPIYTFCFTS